MNGVNGLGGIAHQSRLNGPARASQSAQVEAQARQEAEAAEAGKFQQALQSQNVKMGAFVMNYIMSDLLEQLMKDPNDPTAV